MKLFSVPFLCALLCLPAGLRAGNAKLSGQVTAQRRVAAAESGGAYADQSLKHVVLFDYDSLKNVVVYAERLGSEDIQPPAKDASISLKKWSRGFSLEPSFSAMPSNAGLAIKNDAPEPLILCAGGDSPKHFLVHLDPRKETSIHLWNIGLYQLFPLEDAGARAEVFVASPFFGLADEQGRYSFQLPAGRYKVTAWHERLPPQTQDIQIAPEEVRVLDFVLSVKQLPEVQ